MQRGFFEELRKLRALDLSNHCVTVDVVKSLVRALQHQTLLCRPRRADAIDVGLFLRQFVPVLLRLLSTRRQVQTVVLTWVVSLNHIFGKQHLRDVSTALVAGMLAQPRPIRRSFVMKTLIHSTRFDCSVFAIAIEATSSATSVELRAECHSYVTQILEHWPLEDKALAIETDDQDRHALDTALLQRLLRALSC
ncbi:hypothetical protein SPRG_03185 [Saprolegnia parasitica CBS 223.65]|uniref:Uncharacterized protein n=1 Tax=Saprolegnia parasitica (strain CBS 223.65) TaxID=695850 RepID=A0A067CMN9_SAPPC|nr:hypothetical protein SPRG_03185 [Saprolegnia parasitica CBS 223.65]KDO31969.1 hypothetical protein SPRG_03185 [Saprolegnia parasitica CBS 223.65]|eukprot:XP_012197165.1 hypothetical protein SPRG_03185 [Saprolegnia parasitica CBS 223.65]